LVKVQPAIELLGYIFTTAPIIYMDSQSCQDRTRPTQLYANSLETRLAVSGCHRSLLKYPGSESKIWGIILESACFWCTTRSGVTPEKGVLNIR